MLCWIYVNRTLLMLWKTLKDSDNCLIYETVASFNLHNSQNQLIG